MRNINERRWKILDGVTDALILILSFLLAYFIRFHIMDGAMNDQQKAFFGTQTQLTVVYSFLIMCFYYFVGRYTYPEHYRTERDIAAVVLVNLFGTLFYTAILYFAAVPDYSRMAIGFFYAIGTVVVICKRIAVQGIVRCVFRNGYNHRHVVVVGSGYLAEKYIRTAREETERGVCVDGYIANQKGKGQGKHLGEYSQIGRILEECTPDEIIIALGPQELEMMSTILPACEHSGIRTCIIPYYNDYLPNCSRIEMFGKCKLINIRTIPLDNPFYAALKRSFDVLVSGLAILLLSPLMLAAVVGILITDPGPVFFCQERVGKNKKPFTMYKFRSMPVNVDHTGWSSAADVRPTKFGRLIRKFSIDELPQLWNVFLGDMSLVGPRPELPKYVRKFSEDIPLYLVRQQVRPGMTGLAQINGLRGDTSIERRVEFDIAYIENWTWILDLKILAKTAWGGFMNQESILAEKPVKRAGKKRKK